MKISKQQLVEAGACEAGLQWFLSAVDGIEDPVDVLSLRGKGVRTGDVVWFLHKFIPLDRMVTFSLEVLSTIHTGWGWQLLGQCDALKKQMCEASFYNALRTDRAKTVEAVYKLLGEYE